VGHVDEGGQELLDEGVGRLDAGLRAGHDAQRVVLGQQQGRCLLGIDTERDGRMSNWTSEQLETLGEAEEIRIAATDDGDPGADVPVWVVRVGDDLYVRSVKGRAGRWYQHLARSHHRRVSAGGLECEIRVEDPGVAVNAGIDAAYGQKYGRWGDRYIEAMTTPDVTSTTLRLLPG
jgi:hypothetical protein